ncbi:MAG: long-chain fatty acid--CoA ligase [Actinobacteria bacterium]|nr:long-chain fatty acid--CoA ligase [Actinomycetota bacterium]
MTAPAGGNLAELVRAAAESSPDKAAFLFRDRTLTWSEVDRTVDAVAAGLIRLGARTGDRVAVQLGNTPDFPLVYFGALRAGLVAVPVNTSYTRGELSHCLGDSGARVLVTSRSGADVGLQLVGKLGTLEHVVVADVASAPQGATSLDELGRPGERVDAVGGGEDLAVLIYTSGTSGRPKGAMLSHRALLANLEQCSHIDPPATSPDDVVLLVLPLFHIYGLNAALGAVAREGATGVLIERFDPVDTLEEVRRRHVTNLVGAPPMYVAWSMLPDIGDAFSSVRLALSGAAPLPSAVLHRVLDVTGHHVFEGYGLTETAPVLTTTLMSEVAKPASIGRPVPGVELRLVDEQGQPVEEGDPGEIVVRGANVFSGYWPDGAGGPDEDGWFATGDIAVQDDDGDLFLVDRRKELILVSGFNVYPREVEDVLSAHPDIAEAAVLGVTHPYTGESVKALVVLEPEGRLSAEDVIAHCARSLARFKCPTAVEFVPELPHSATGKVSKGRLREAALGG